MSTSRDMIIFNRINYFQPKVGSPRKLSPALPVQSPYGRPWFAGRMDRAECEGLLMRSGGEGDFMVRESLNRVSKTVHTCLTQMYM